MLTISQPLSRIKGNLAQHSPEALNRQHGDELSFVYVDKPAEPI